jgi:hypothetical protein
MAAVYPALATSRCTFTERRKHTTSGTCRVRCRQRARNPLAVEHQPHPRCYTSSSAGSHQGSLHVGAWNGESFVEPGSECCTHRRKRFILASKLSLCYDPTHWFSFWQCNGSDLNPTFRNELTPAHRRIESWAPKISYEAAGVDDVCHCAPNPTWAWHVCQNYGVRAGVAPSLFDGHCPTL